MASYYLKQWCLIISKTSYAICNRNFVNSPIISLYPPQRSCGRVYWFHSVRPSVLLPSVGLSVHPAWHVLSVACCLFHGLYSFVGNIQPMKGQCVTYCFQVNTSKVKVTWVVSIFMIRMGGILVDHQSVISSSQKQGQYHLRPGSRGKLHYRDVIMGAMMS